MKNIYKWVVPDFLRRWDRYLLERYPVVWHTGAHFVVFYALMGAVLLFGAGFLYPVHKDGTDWVVDPIKPIEFGEDNLYVYPLITVLTFSLLWVYRQFQAGFPFYQLKHTLVTLLIYAGCFWLLIGVTASAFRMGTIVKTAWFWMAPDDLTIIEESGIYPYGFMLLDRDTSLNIALDTLRFFQTREQAFKKRWLKEGEILNQRYKVYLVKLSYGSSSRTNLSDLSLPDLSGLSDLSYMIYRSDENYRSSRPDVPYLLNLSHQTNLKYRLYLSAYSALKAKENFKKIDALALQYGITNKQVILEKHPLIIIPSLPNQIEDAVRSVMHACQFLHEGVFLQHFFQIGRYLMPLVLLLFFSTFLVLRYIFQIVIVFYLINFLAIPGRDNILWSLIILPSIGLFMLFWLIAIKTKHRHFKIYINMVFLGIAWVLYGAVFLTSYDPASPDDYHFYGAQLIGLISACLVPHVQALPEEK
ncbi:MAG TPA: hypothetical protein PLC89_27730 [Haliscomenobacter sp.]|uniref:hypothetical protein n=1 Tax=Haliscomenobacter sp. TaxID=2717303 RepID=UPI002BA39AEA|nr:hypothetical protein [Haliscomenobacter sp.]HOY21135.1 hypothetical protein [Haliscomenobacter sp.]